MHQPGALRRRSRETAIVTNRAYIIHGPPSINVYKIRYNIHVQATTRLFPTQQRDTRHLRIQRQQQEQNTSRPRLCRSSSSTRTWQRSLSSSNTGTTQLHNVPVPANTTRVQFNSRGIPSSRQENTITSSSGHLQQNLHSRTTRMHKSPRQGQQQVVST